MKKAVIFVPHPDDELLVGGGLLYSFAHSKEWNVKVVFATNGDFYAHEAEIRLNEAIHSCKILGIDEENVIFLGYGDRWEENHIYNSEHKCISKAGRTETYGLSKHPEYRYCKDKIHSKYTRENYKNDIKNIITENNAEILICVEYDSHPDHRALALLFNEAIQETLKENKNYHPLILKKLAYENVMHGVKDYYQLPHRRTRNKGNNLDSTPILKWDERICLMTPEECNTLRLTKNPLYKAACCYKSQAIRYKMISSINSDMVYWRIPSENLAIFAEINVSSGNGTYVNDLKTIDSRKIDKIDCHLDASVWIPDKSDNEKTIQLNWKEKQRISRIDVFENPNEKCNIYELEIFANGELIKNVKNIKHDGAVTVIQLDKVLITNNLKFQIISGTDYAGISEISIYDKIENIEAYNLPCKIVENVEESEKQKIEFIDYAISYIDYIAFCALTIARKMFMTKYYIMRHYPKSISNHKMIPIYRFYHFFYRIILFIKNGGALF